MRALAVASTPNVAENHTVACRSPKSASHSILLRSLYDHSRTLHNLTNSIGMSVELWSGSK
jgi:hypothetical protein